MLKYFLFYTLAVQTIWAKPVQQPGDIASHIVIVTPQAQVHLEPALKYEAPATFIQHLSPLARIGAPLEETIVYVPASAAAPVIPAEAINLGHASLPFEKKAGSETKQYDQIITEINHIQGAIQEGSAQFGPGLSEAAAGAAAAASAAGAGLFPAFFPPGLADKDKVKPEIAPALPAAPILPAAQPLIPAEARRFYALAPAVPHVVDFVHAPVFVGPVSAVRARSIQESEVPVIAIPLPEAGKPEALPLKTILKEELKKPVAEPEKKTEFGRFLLANTFKEEPKPELDESFKRDNLPAAEPEAAPSQLIAEPAQPQIIQPAEPAYAKALSQPAGVVGQDVVAPIVVPVVAPKVVAEVVDELPQSKVD